MPIEVQSWSTITFNFFYLIDNLRAEAPASSFGGSARSIVVPIAHKAAINAKIILQETNFHKATERKATSRESDLHHDNVASCKLGFEIGRASCRERV